MKTIEEIYDEMLSVFREKTGMEGSAVDDLSVKLYAVAAQVYGLYVQADWLSRQCFPQTATGEYLERHAALRGLERRGGVTAKGLVRFSVDVAAATDLTIPAGTVCATAAQTRFVTTVDAVLRAGKLCVEVPAEAVESGVSGNVPAGSILAMTVPPVGISRCVNPNAFTGGVNAEDDDALRIRVLDTYRRMPNGANAAFYEQGALSFEEVAACTVLPRNRGVGTVDVVIATAAGLPGADLINQVQAYFEKRREIAVNVLVKAPTVKSVDVAVSLETKEGYKSSEIQANVKAAIANFFSGERLSRSVLLAELNQLVFSQEGVANCKITAPAADVAIQAGVLPRLGKVTVGVTA